MPRSDGPGQGTPTRRGAQFAGPGLALGAARGDAWPGSPVLSGPPLPEESQEAEIDLATLGERIHGGPHAAEPEGPQQNREPRSLGLSLAVDSSGGDLDLDVELDLPSVGRANRPKTPAPHRLPMVNQTLKSATADPEELDLDDELGLPLIVGGDRRAGDVEERGTRQGKAAPRSPGSGGAFDQGDSLELDLPSLGGEPELPSPRADIDLASEHPAGSDDLPSLVDGVLPAPVKGDLPLPAEGGLPSPAQGGLPSPVTGELPVRVEGELPSIPGAAPARAGGRSRAPTETSVGEGRESEGAAFDLSSFVEGALPDLGSLSLEDFGEPSSRSFDTFDPGASEPSADDRNVLRETGGGTSFGEINLGGADEPMPVPSTDSAESLDDMEFRGLPQADDESVPHGADVAAPLQGPVSGAESSREGLPSQAPKPRRRRSLWIGAVVGILGLGGAALVLVPSVGPYGAYFLFDRFNRQKYERVVAEQVQEARKGLASDTRSSAAAVMRNLERTLREYKRVRSLTAYAAFVGEFIELRFREEPAVKARADVLLDDLADSHDVKYQHLAQATRAAAEGKLALARQLLDQIRAADAKLVDAHVVRAELALYAGEPKIALEHWTRAEQRSKSPLTAFGLARSYFAAGNMAKAGDLARETLKRSSHHIGARILLARILWTVERNDVEALRLLEQALKRKQDASALEIVEAYTLVGDIHLELSRVTLAETAYGEALKVKPQAARALAGLGDTLYRAGRYSEALARFEAAIQADPDELSAAVGAAKTKIALEKNRDAAAMLKKLRDAHPKSALVHYWFGKAEEALGNRESAEKEYRAALETQTRSTELVDAYVALALLMNQQGRRDEAQKVLDQARSQLADSPEIYQALGQLALVQGRYDEALQQFRSALKLNPEDLSSKFSLGVALRRDRQIDAAAEVFDEVAKLDRDYPGLALERGLLYEASGRTEEALKSYESALAKAPDDPDLMLRVGCGKVTAGRSDQAIQLLRKVLTQRPNSAETNHCLGRALLLEGSNLALALRTLKHAVDLDPNRAEYHLYVGWAANEAGRVVEAEAALQRALALDQGLGDAYWQRGILRYRQGAVKDAVADLTRAIELKPGRHEAHAALADALHDLGDERGALAQWRQAVESQPDNATWHYRYGRVLQQNQLSNEARVELSKALELAEKTDPPPRWKWEAHRLLARAIGRQTEAIKHWQAFLRMSPTDNAYREEAKSELAKLGTPWEGD